MPIPQDDKTADVRSANIHAVEAVKTVGQDLNSPLAMSVDVEEYFQVGAFEQVIEKKDWPDLQPRLDYQISLILDMFAAFQIKATFFTLGWVADHAPDVVRKIVGAGHELACHGYAHDRLFHFSKDDFKQDLLRAKNSLEQVSGRQVTGYRAPSFSLRDDCLWAYDVLVELGFKYSSSVYPVAHDHYGSPNASRVPYHPVNQPDILEIPPSTCQMIGRNLPVAGGGYFRLFPYFMMKHLMQRAQKQLLTKGGQAVPLNFYFHPWEVDPAQPRITGGGIKSQFRHYVGLSRMAGKLRTLLADYQAQPFSQAYGPFG